MKNRVKLVVIFILFLPFLIKAEWVSLDKNSTTQKPPEVTLISDDNSGTVLKIDISGFDLKNFSSGDQNYQMIDLLTESFITHPGKPELPYITKVLAIPDQAGVSIEILEKGAVQSFNDIYLPPARESWIEGSPESSYVEDLEVYGSFKEYPGIFAENDPPSIFRDFRITCVSVFPFQYIPAKKELRVVNSITVRINYNPDKCVNPKTTPKKPIAPSFGNLYRSTIFNYQSVLNKLYGGTEDGHDLMICIMPDDFYEPFQDYALWKRQSGIDIHITKFSDIGANSSDPNIIKNHLIDAYTNWEVAPTYALLVGDNGVFPVYSSGNENYFGEIEGNDYFPELMIGRLTNQSVYQLQVMLHKFLLYEQTPDTTDTDWFMKATVCSNDAYASQIYTKRFAAEVMIEDGKFSSVDTMMSDPGCTYSVNDVMTAINEGRSFLNYRGEGWSSGWWATCTPMNTSHVMSLNNGQKFTFVTSIGCGVAMFTGSCFGEAWLELGTISNPGGACAFIGPAGNTHTTYNNKIDKGIYVGLFQEGLETAGQAMVRGKLYMYNVFGNTSMVESHYQKYCVLGDPSIHVWKDIPREVNLDYPSSIAIGTNLVEVTVSYANTGLPVEDALVCITGNTQFGTAYTDELGKAYVDVESEDLETFIVTVRGIDVYPKKGTMLVAPPTGPYVIYQSIELDDATGNNNGIMETSESILATLTVENVGVEIAGNVTVGIETTDPYVNITDNSEFYGNINANSTAFIEDGFAWDVANNIPDLHHVNFEVSTSDGNETWVSYFDVVGHAPELEIGYMSIDDSEQGNNNGRLDPGETVDIHFETYNNGSFEALNSIGEIYTENPNIILNNIIHEFGTLEIGTMEEAIFNVTVDINASIGESLEITFSVASGGYFIEKLFYTKIGLILEDWEGGDMTQFDWQTGGDSDWFVTDDDVYEGVYSAKSGDIEDNQVSWLQLDYEVVNPDTISFYFKVSSESNYDYLRFYINNVGMGEWSGQVSWQKASYVVTPGNYTFEWEYYKDFSISSGSDCAWIDYIVLPSSALSAYFIADNTDPCMDDEVQFTDVSSGSPTSWQWEFEGGDPATSNEQNPTILYSTEGNYNVSLTVSDGVESDLMLLENYITVHAMPDVPPTPIGSTIVCANEESSTYNTTGLPGISDYFWFLEPAEAGYLINYGLQADIYWINGYVGEATLKVAGENVCGTGEYSDHINITCYLPDVTLEPFDYVCVDWPAFELTGGLPPGGEYSGPGIENGWFDPVIAGIGTHEITYTYSDPEECEHYTTETILVDPCTGINDEVNQNEFEIYPNPTTGMVTIGFNDYICPIEVDVVNTLGDMMYSFSTETLPKKKLRIDLSHLPKGIYFIKIKVETMEKTTKIVLW